MQLSQSKKSLLQLAKDAFEGNVMLPDFQRPFVRTRTNIEELIQSLLEDMFIGTFLINHITPNDTKFKVIPIDGANMVNKEYKEKPYMLVLDGQQRLTSFFYALYEPDRCLINTKYPYRFFINIEKLLKRDSEEMVEVDEIVFSLSTGYSEYKTLIEQDGTYKMSILVEKKILPLAFLKDFFEIWYSHNQWDYKEQDSKKIRDLIKRITEYQIMTIEVPINESLSDIAKLFEKTNRTGIKLSVFDLLTARLYKFINLRTKREESYDINYYIKKFVGQNKRDTKLAYHIIQAIALSSGSKSIKSQDILELTEAQLNEDKWNNAINIIEDKVLKMFFSIDEFGIADEKRLSYKHMIIVYLALFLENNIDIDKVKNWHWASLFTERYSGSTESKLTKDYKDLLKWFEDENAIPFVVKNARELLESTGDIFSLKDKRYSGSASYKGVFNLLFMNKAKDFYEKETIKYSSLDLDDHHIFPRNFLEKKIGKNGSYGTNYDTILNKTLILSGTNRKISDKSPGDYIAKMIEIHGSEQKVKQILEDHFIDDQMYHIIKNMNENTDSKIVLEKFEMFITLREKRIKERVKSLVGIYNEDKAIQDLDAFLENISENKNAEFKSTLRRDVRQNTNGGKSIEYNAMKTIAAFLNSQGGELIIGIDDNKKLYGLEKDYETLGSKSNKDGFLLHCDNLIKTYIGNEFNGLIDIHIYEKDGHDIAIVFVRKSNIPVYLKYEGKEEFYIRRNASSIKLETKEAHVYIDQHF